MTSDGAVESTRVRVSGESIVRAETVRTFGRKAPGKSASCFVFFVMLSKDSRVKFYKFGDERESGARGG